MEEERGSEVLFTPDKVRPVRNNLLVKIISGVEQISDGGIHLVEQRRRTHILAKVAKIGPDVKYVAEGDIVMLPESVGAEEARWAFVNEYKDVWAIVEKGA